MGPVWLRELWWNPSGKIKKILLGRGQEASPEYLPREKRGPGGMAKRRRGLAYILGPSPNGLLHFAIAFCISISHFAFHISHCAVRISTFSTTYPLESRPFDSLISPSSKPIR